MDGVRRNVKQTIYLFFTTAFGILLSYLAHAFLEMWYLRWAQDAGRAIVWTKHLGIGACALPVWVQYGLLALGLVGGFLTGRIWWRMVYERPHEHRGFDGWFARVVFVILAVGLGAYAFSKGENEVHFHAAFQVYVDGQRMDFSALRYMDVEPCTDASLHEQADSVEEQKEKGHLHDGVGDVVHVERDAAVWQDLFTNIGYTFPGAVVGYVNGVKTVNILQQEIHPYERALFVVGTVVADIRTLIDAVPHVEYIKTVEAKSETCGS